MQQAKLSLEMQTAFSDEKKALAAFTAIEPEFFSKHEKRAQTTASAKKNLLVLSTIAEDLPALKASMNSFSKSIALAKDLIGG